MAPTEEFPSEIRELLKAGALRRVSDTEFAIDALQHRVRTWMGWNTVSYELRIEEGDEGQPLYEIAEQTEELGEQIVLSSADVDDATFWVTDQIQEKER
ncbi:MAG: hypothetical protein JWN24_1333 [Phycisphaerales bacterium]|nr:hypothetical protein [Phycisphaerales bacterium]